MINVARPAAPAVGVSHAAYQVASELKGSTPIPMA